MLTGAWNGVKRGWRWWWRSKAGRYTIGVLLGLDQLGNTLLGGNPDETISSRLGRKKILGGGRISWRYPASKLLDALLEVVDPGHSIGAVEYDELSPAQIRELDEALSRMAAEGAEHPAIACVRNPAKPRTCFSPAYRAA